MDEFKGTEAIFDFLNSGDKSYTYAVHQLEKKPKLLKNLYTVNRKTFEVKIKNTFLMWDNLMAKSSNMEEFFDVVDW